MKRTRRSAAPLRKRSARPRPAVSGPSRNAPVPAAPARHPAHHLPAGSVEQVRHPLWTVLFFLLGAGLIVGGVWAVSSSGLIANRFKPTLERELSKALNRPVSVARLEGGVIDRVVLRNVRIGAPAADPASYEISIARVVVRYSLWDLLVRKRPLADSLREIQLIRPLLAFAKDAQGVWHGPNLMSWSAPDTQTPVPKIPAIKITLYSGELRLESPDGRASLKNLRGQFNLADPANARLNLTGRAGDRRTQNVKAEGEFNLQQGSFRITLAAHRLPLRTFERVARPSEFLEVLDGFVNLDLTLVSRRAAPGDLIPGVDLQGKLVLDDLDLKTSLLGEPLRGLYGVTLLKNDRVILKTLQAQLGNTSWKATGTLEHLQKPAVSVKVASDHLRLEDLTAAAPTFAQLQTRGEGSAVIMIRGEAPDLAATATMRMSDGRIGKVRIRDFESISRFAGNELKLLLARGTVAQGWIEGKGRIVFAADPQQPAQAEFAGEARGVALEDVASLFAVQGLRGRVNGTVALRGALDAPSLSARLSSDRLVAAGMEFKHADLSLALNATGVTLTARSDWGSLPAVELSAMLDRLGEGWRLRQARLSQNGKELVKAGGDLGVGPAGALAVVIRARLLPMKSVPYLPPALKHIRGMVDAEGYLGGTLKQPWFCGHFASEDLLRLPGRSVDGGGSVLVAPGRLVVRDFEAGQGRIRAQGSLNLARDPAVNAELTLRGAGLDSMSVLLGADYGPTLPRGSVTGACTMQGTLRRPLASGDFTAKGISWNGVEAESGRLVFAADARRIRVRTLELRQPGGAFQAAVDSAPWGAEGPLRLSAQARHFQVSGRTWDGRLTVEGATRKAAGAESTSLRLATSGLRVGERPLPVLAGEMTYDWMRNELKVLRLSWGERTAATGRFRLGAEPEGESEVRLNQTRLTSLREILAPGRGALAQPVGGSLKFAYSGQRGTAGIDLTLGEGKASGEAEWSAAAPGGPSAVRGQLALAAAPLQPLFDLFLLGVPKNLPAGTATGAFEVRLAQGALESTTGQLEIAPLHFGEWHFKRLKLAWEQQGDRLVLKQLEGEQPDGSLAATNGTLQKTADGGYLVALPLVANQFKLIGRHFNGHFSTQGTLRIERGVQDLRLAVSSQDFGLNLAQFGDFRVQLRYQGQELSFLSAPDLPYRITGQLRLPPDGSVEFQNLECAVDRQKLLSFNGLLDSGGGRSDLRVVVNGVGADTIARTLNWPQPWTGKAYGTVHYTDPNNHPAFKVEVRVENGSVLRLPFDTFAGTIDAENDWLYFRGPANACVLTKQNQYTLYLSGKLPLPMTAQAAETMRGAELDVRAWMPEGDFSYITFIPYFSAAHGRSSLDLQIRGTMDYPSLSGAASVTDGSLSPRLYSPLIEHLTGRLRFDNNRVYIDVLEGRVGEGTLAVKAGPAAGWAAVFRRLEPDELNLALESRQGRLWLDSTIDYEFVSAWANVKATIGGTMAAPVFGGTLELSDGQFTYPAKPLSAFTRGLKGGNTQYANLRLIARKNFWFYNDLVRAQIKPDNSVVLNGGRNDFAGDGAITISKGTFTYLDTDFNLDPSQEAILNFQGHELPRLNALASTVIRDVQIKDQGRTRDATIYLRVTGPLGELKIALSSEPVMTQAQIVSLLTLGEDYSSWSQNALDQKIQSAGARVLGKWAGNLLGREIEKRVKKFAPVDVIGIRFGGVEELAGSIAGGGNTATAAGASGGASGANLLQNTQIDVGKYVTDDLYLNYRGTLKDRGTEKGGMSWQSLLGLEYNLGGSRKLKLHKNFDADSNQEFYWGIESRNEFKSWTPEEGEPNTPAAAATPKKSGFLKLSQ